MGCDIHSFGEVRSASGTYETLLTSPFNWRAYGMFALIFGVRNNSYGFVPIAKNRGLPVDVSVVCKASSDAYGYDSHSHSWISVKELQEFDYESLILVRHEYISCKELLGTNFFTDLQMLVDANAERVVVFFDN